MSGRFAQLQARSRSIAQLGEVVAAMRGVAAARAQQSYRQLESVRAYADVVAQAISQVLAILPGPSPDGHERDRGLALLLICAEHGFAGAFSEKILELAGAAPATSTLLIVGSRGVRLARARGLTPAWSAPMVSQLANAGILADRIGAQLYRCLRSGRIGRVDVVCAKPETPESYLVARRSLLPLDYARFGPAGAAMPPLFNLAPQALLERLAGEYLFAQLNEAIVHGYVAENSARLQTMTAARENIRHRLQALTRDGRLARQEEITAEIIELAAGAEAQRAGGGR